MTADPFTVDHLFEALDRGDSAEVAVILRHLTSLSQVDLDLLADYFQPGANELTPFVVKLARRGRGRPRKSYADRTRILTTALGVKLEQTNPAIEPEKWASKTKPRSLAVEDYAMTRGRSASSVKDDLAKSSRRKRPRK